MASHTLCSEPRYRLSKPRTYTTTTSSAFLESRADLSSPLSSKQSSPGLSVGKDESFSGAQMRQSLREHLFGDGQVSRRDDISDEEESGGIADNTLSMRQRISRTGTMLSKRASIRLSINPPGRSSTSLVRDTSTEPEDEEEVAVQIRQKAHQDKLTALHQPLQVTVEDDGVEETLISPIRRRSLMTPGLATRHPTDILAKPPAPRMLDTESETEHYYNRNLSESSPLARIAALDLANQAFDAESRCATPLDIDYGNLSGPGILRITNGVASPVPSMHSATVSTRMSSTDLRNQTEYFSLSHAQRLENRAGALRLQEVRRSGEFADAGCEYAKRQSGEISRTDSDRGHLYQRSSMSYEISPEPMNHLHQFTTIQPRPTSRDPNRISLIAEDYMLDLSDNPFAAEVTTKPNEFEDDLFEDQAPQKRASAYSVRQQDNNDGLVAMELPDSLVQERGAMLGDLDVSWDHLENVEFRDMDIAEESRLPQMTKADSGYSSGSSLRSVNQPAKRSFEERRHKLTKKQSKVIDSPKNSILSAEKSTSEDPVSRPQLTTMPTTTTKSSLFTWSYQNSSDTIPTILSTNTSSSQVSTTSRRLQKPRPKSQPPPLNRQSIQSHPEITAATVIPDVPRDIAERNARRVRDLPPLDHTLPSVSDEKLKPEMDMSPPLLAPVRFPTPSLEDQEVPYIEPKKSRRVSLRQSLLKPDRVQRRSSYQAAATADDRETIATLGDITKSLGIGPYDAAFLQQGYTQKRRVHTPVNHIAPSMQRKAKSMIGMNDYEAAEVSRMRTKYKTSSLDARNVDMKPTPPSTLGKKHFNDRGGIPGKMPHLSTTYQNQPPLPEIPVSIQVHMKEARIANFSREQTTRSRPVQRKAHSMVVEQSNFVSSSQPLMDWSTSCEAWAKHRRLAGEALNDVSPEPTMVEHSRITPGSQYPQRIEVPTRWSLPPPERDSLSHSRSRVDILRSGEQSSPSRQSLPLPSESGSLNARKSFQHSSSTPSLLSPRLLKTEIHPSTTSPQQEPFNIPAGTVARLSGRFAGGLGYGYEPGCGIGGSAGTRSSPNKASRKSVQVSKGFGLDLSDIPVFVSPSPSFHRTD